MLELSAQEGVDSIKLARVRFRDASGTELQYSADCMGANTDEFRMNNFIINTDEFRTWHHYRNVGSRGDDLFVANALGTGSQVALEFYFEQAVQIATLVLTFSPVE